MSTRKTTAKPQFYDIFKFGPEFEMEIPYHESLGSILNREPEDLVYFTGDGSINRTKTDSQTCELIAQRPFESQEDEDKFLAKMQEVLPEFESKSGEMVFAHHNRTAGTHFHWSFKDKPDSMLFLYDTIEFEKFFFMRYIETFKSEKFLSRIHYQYCLAPNIAKKDGSITSPNEVKQALKNLFLIPFIGEYEKTGRRRWLNTQSIGERTGLEVRIFPFLQTHKGVKQTMEFMKETILEFYLRPDTQLKMELLKEFDKIEFFVDSENNRGRMTRNLNLKKLSQTRQVVLNALTEKESIISGETRMIIGEWLRKNPKLLIQDKAF